MLPVFVKHAVIDCNFDIPLSQLLFSLLNFTFFCLLRLDLRAGKHLVSSLLVSPSLLFWDKS